MTQLPWKPYSPLRSHDFADGRFMSSSEPSRLYICRNCYRAFKHDPGTKRTWAVGRDERCSDLDSSVNRRWLAEECAGGPSNFDEHDSQQFRLPLV